MGESKGDYVVWSHHLQAWEAGERDGYTPFFSEATRYSRDRAFAICLAAVPPGMGANIITLPEVPVLAADIVELLAATAR